MAKKQRASRKPGWKEALVVIALAVLLSLVRQMSTPSYDMSSIPDYDGTSAYTVIDRNQPPSPRTNTPLIPMNITAIWTALAAAA